MKKVFRFLLCLLLVFALTSCDMNFGGTTTPSDDEDGYKIVLKYENGEDSKTIYGEGAVELETPEYDGFTFIGWYTKDDELFDGEVTKDITLTAKWVEIGQKFNITYNTNGGEFSTEYETSYAHGTAFNLPTPELKDNEFMGWYKDEDLTDGPYTKITKSEYGDQAFYASFKPTSTNTKAVNYVLDGGTLPTNAPTSYVPGQTCKLVPATKEGYIFRGWFNNPDFTGNIIKVINAGQKTDLTFYAKFVKDIPQNLNVSILGDSISTYTGWIPSNYVSAYPNYDLTSVEETWWRIAIKEAGMNYCANASYSGGNVHGTDLLSGSNADRIKNLASATLGNPDIVIIHMGVNDATNVQVPKATFKADYKKMVEAIQEAYPGVDVVVCTMIPAKDFGSVTSQTLYNQYVEAIIELASEMNLTLIRLDQAINSTNMETCMADAKHPNVAGMQVMGEEVARVLKNTYPITEE